LGASNQKPSGICCSQIYKTSTINFKIRHFTTDWHQFMIFSDRSCWNQSMTRPRILLYLKGGCKVPVEHEEVFLLEAMGPDTQVRLRSKRLLRDRATHPPARGPIFIRSDRAGAPLFRGQCGSRHRASPARRPRLGTQTRTSSQPPHPHQPWPAI
jgi:hypothetical protein